MWRQEMLPSILHGCHFDTISSSSIKNSVPDIFDQTSYSCVDNAQLTVVHSLCKTKTPLAVANLSNCFDCMGFSTIRTVLSTLEPLTDRAVHANKDCVMWCDVTRTVEEQFAFLFLQAPFSTPSISKHKDEWSTECISCLFIVSVLDSFTSYKHKKKTITPLWNRCIVSNFVHLDPMRCGGIGFFHGMFFLNLNRTTLDKLPV
jgi:hypothetical protein